MSKTVDEIHKSILDNIDEKYQKTVGFPTYDITRAAAVALADQSADIETAAGMIDVENLAGSELEHFISQRKNISRKQAVKAGGYVSVTVNSSITLPAGALFATTNNVLFQTITENALPVGTSLVQVEAVEGGVGGNAAAGTVTKIPITIANVTAVTNAEPMTGGYDAETDEALRERYYFALQKPITAGNKNQYESWAMEVDGVGAAEVFPLANGDNTVEVCIVGNDGNVAGSELIAKVQQYIDPGSSGKGEGAAPIGAYCTVTTATVLSVAVSVKIRIMSEQDKTEITDEVKAAVSEYINNSFGMPSISYAKIGAVIMSVDGVMDYANLKVNNGTSNITVGDRKMAKAGELTVTYE